MPRLRFALIGVWLLAPSAALAQEKDAKALAQEILTKGAALFDTRDASAMAETYTEDARVFWVERNKDSGGYKVDAKEGPDAIERLYRDLWKDPNQAKTTSRNTVEFARYVAPDLIVIYGHFEPEVDRGKYHFVQERVKKGDKWLIQSLRLYVIPE